MLPGSEHALAAAATVVVLLIIIYIWYTMFGWTPSTFTTGQVASWTAPSGDTSSLRFRNMIFRVRTADGKTSARNVTAIVNKMAQAFDATGGVNTGTLTLDRPLNAFSFVIAGMNDRATIKTAADKVASPLNHAPVSLIGSWRTI